MHPSRVRGRLVDWLHAVAAGIIDSRNGSAIVTPTPRRNVRRGRAVLEMNMG